MISNQILQNTIEGLKTITSIDICIIDTEGKELASTFSETLNFELGNIPYEKGLGQCQLF